MPTDTDSELEIARLRSRIESLRAALFAVQSTRRRNYPGDSTLAHVKMRRIAFDALKNDDVQREQ